MKYFFILIVIALSYTHAYAQEYNLLDRDLSQIDVEALTDQQIRQIATEVERSDMTEQELMNLARLKGMPEAEIARLKQRLTNIDRQKGTDELQGSVDEDLTKENITSERQASIETPADLNRIFGTSLFSSEKLTFEPSLNIPTPRSYQLGPGDELVIDIWGDSRQNYRLQVSREGSINISNLGPVYVSGLNMEQASRKIIDRLSEIYTGLKGPRPATYAQVGIGKVRSVKVTLLGEVRVPGTYTLPALATVFNALYLSGGPALNGSFRDIEVIRENKVITTIDVYDFLLGGKQENNIYVEDQDIIRVNPYQKRVEVKGAVKRPMIYEVKEGENLDQLIEYAAGFTDQAYTHRLKVHRKTSRERRIEDVPQEAFQQFSLKNGDIVEVESILNRYENRVEIKGAVYRSGEYQLTEGLTVINLVEKAEGLREDAFLGRAIIFRTRDDYSTEVIPFNLREMLQDPTKDILLEREDVIHISSKYDLKEDYHVSIYGAVQAPSTFPYMDNMSLEDLILMAGGFSEAASVSRIEVARRLKKEGVGATSDEIAEVFQFSVDGQLELGSSEAKFILQPFDQVYVREYPGYQVQRSVAISGEVLYPGSYALQSKDEHLSDLILRTGGLTHYAYPEGATLERTIWGDTTQIGINLVAILEKPHSKFDLYLLPGDRIHIPKELQTVAIKGQVLNPVAIKYQRNFGFRDYIASAGGFTSVARKRKVYVRYPDGSADRTRKFLVFNNYPKVTPGSTIFVPEEPERTKLSAQEVIGISTGLATISLLIVSIIGR
ncbi:MAG: SLBB domain-containing protein [Bacteroidia bacterium]